MNKKEKQFLLFSVWTIFAPLSIMMAYIEGRWTTWGGLWFVVILFLIAGISLFLFGKSYFPEDKKGGNNND